MPDSARFDLLMAFVRREVSVRYKEAYVGVAWAVIQPLTYMAIFTVLFGRVARVPGSGPLVAYVALVPWTFAATAISQGSSAVLNQLGIVSKIYFPREVLPLSAVVAALVDAGIAFVLQLALQVIFGAGPPLTLLLWPFLMLLTAALCLGIGLILAPAIVRFRDLRFVIPLGLQLLLLASPVGYPLEAVPASWRGWYRINPFAGLLDAFRVIALDGRIPPWVDIWPALAWTLGLLALGFLYFRAEEPTMADYV